MRSVSIACDASRPPGQMTETETACRRVFLFSSQGGQWPGMGSALYAQEPAFRRVIDACDREIGAHLGWSLRDLIRRDPSDVLVRDPFYIQPALTAVQLGLCALLRLHGRQPDAVAGLSMGEVSAACEAGVLTLEEGMRVVCVQAECTRHQQPSGRMAFVRQPREAVERRLAATRGQRLWLAVELTPSLSVVSGVASAVEQWLAEQQREGVPSGYLPSGFAFHSPLVDTLEPAFRAGLASLRPRKPRLPIFSAADERQPAFGVDHWWRIMREPATLRRMVNTLLDRGAKQLIEVGPEPILVDAVCENIAAARSDARVTALLRRSAASAADVKRAAQAMASS